MLHVKFCAAAVLFGVMVSIQPGAAQDSSLVPRPRVKTLPPGVVTSVQLNGTRYFIAIAHVDTSNMDHMPIVGREVIWPDVRIERNIQILPDSLLRRFPRKEGPSR